MTRGLAASLFTSALVAACHPATTIGGFTTEELCGGSPTAFDISPAPLNVRSTGTSFAPGTSVTVSGSPPYGALNDTLATLGWTEGAHGSITIDVEDASTLSEITHACGVTLPSAAGSYALATKPGAILIAGAPEGQANALATLAQLPTNGQLPAANILDGPALATRFMLEGFYGPPWSWDQRTQMLHAAASQKFNTYVHAPKGDPLSTYLWPIPFDQGTLAEAQAFVDAASSLGMQVCWEISPGGTITFSDVSQQQEMQAKFQQLIGLGITCLVLAFDDTPMTLTTADQAVYPSFADAQLAFLTLMDNWLKSQPGKARLQDVTLNTYSTGMMEAYPSYIQTLTQLDSNIQIGWTGLDVVSGEVSAADVAQATMILGRPPALGDNYPVAGTDLVSGPLNMWPIDNRDPAGISALSAYGANGMTLARASLPAYASVAELAWNPYAYDPSRAFAHGLATAAGGPSDAVTFFAELTDGLNSTGVDAAPGLRAALGEYSYDSMGGAPVLAAFFQRMAGIGAELSGINPELLSEIQPWVTKTEAWGQLGGALLAAAQLPASSVSASMVSDLETQLDSLEENPTVIADGPMEAFAQQVLSQLEAASGN